MTLTIRTTNIEVHKETEHSQFCVSWQEPDARYHFWLDGPEDHQKVETIYKNPLDGHTAFRTRRLSTKVEKNAKLVQEVIAHAVRQGLFVRAVANLLERGQAEEDKNRAAFERRCALSTGPEGVALARRVIEYFGRQPDGNLDGDLELWNQSQAIVRKYEEALKGSGNGLPYEYSS